MSTQRLGQSDADGVTIVQHGHDDTVALPLEDVGRAHRLLLARDEDRQRAAALRREVLQVEVGDVDSLRAERLRDACDHARPVRDVHAEALQLARVVVGRLEQAPPVAGRLADPPREKAGVARGQRGFELLDAATVLRQGLGHRVPVLEEDVDPDPRVGAGHAGHVAQRAAGGCERLVALDPHRAGLVEEDVGERVRQVARDRDEAVVRVGGDRDRDRAERGDEAVEQLVPLGLGARDRGQKPGRALEQLGRRPLGAARLGAADRVAADEARLAGRRGDHGALGRADVRHGAAVRGGVEHRPDLRRQRGDRRRDDGQLGTGERGAEIGRGLDRAAFRRPGEVRLVRIPAGHVLDARPSGGEADGRADQAGADDRYAHYL